MKTRKKVEKGSPTEINSALQWQNIHSSEVIWKFFVRSKLRSTGKDAAGSM